jgi:hypothetical protein
MSWVFKHMVKLRFFSMRSDDTGNRDYGTEVFAGG